VDEATCDAVSNLLRKRGREIGNAQHVQKKKSEQELTTADELGYGGGENPTMA